MNRQKKDRIKCLGIAILFITRFIIVAGLYQNSFKPDKSDSFKYKVAALPSFVVSLKDNQLPDSPKNSLSPSEKINFSQFNQYFKIFIDNKLTNQKLISLHKIGLLLEPFSFQGFYYHYMSNDKEDVPILS